MILDKKSSFSDAQAITADAVSTNVINAGAKLGVGEPVKIAAKVVEAFATLTSLTVALQSATDEAFTTPITHQSKTIALAALTLGADIDLGNVPSDTKQYLRLNYDVTGSNATAGKITAGLVHDKQQNTY